MHDTSNHLRIAIVGYGAMGREIERLASSQSCTVVSCHSASNPFAPDPRATVDVAIDFTRPTVVVENIRTILGAGIPMVVGTTGWGDSLEDVRAIARDTNGRLVFASNFSIGVNLFLRIVREASRILAGYSEYDVAVHELHHSHKVDSPSGTARAIAREILHGHPGKRDLLVDTAHGAIDPASLHVTSTRVGATPGTHTVYFDADADTIELIHRARNRSGFALGALAAARWIVGQQPGVYSFENDVM